MKTNYTQAHYTELVVSANFITTQLGGITPSGNDTSDSWWIDGKHKDQDTLVSCGWTLPYTDWNTGKYS